MSNKYIQVIHEINPMSTAPVWDYYNGNVDVIELFYKPEDYIDDPDIVVSCLAYFNRITLHWHIYYNNSVIYDELVGWLPRRKYDISLNRQ